MRSYRPSTRAIAVVAALAATIVVAGTTGAVAGKLITGNDIKDHSITKADLAKGSVGWSGQLDKATRKRITALANAGGAAGQAGVPGAAGVQGPAGAQGSAGAQGPAGRAGTDGAGSLVDWDYFGLDGFSEPDADELSDLVPSGDGIVLSEPGNYLVTMAGTFSQSDALLVPILFAGVVSPGEPTPEVDLNAVLNACSLGNIMSTCQSTFPVTVAEGEPVELPVLVPADTSTCAPDCEPPAYVRMMAYRVGGDPADLGTPTVPAGCLCGPTLSGLSPAERATLRRIAGSD